MDERQCAGRLLNESLAAGNRVRVAVERDHACAGAQDRGRVAARTKCAIENDLIGLHGKRIENFRQHDRDMRTITRMFGALVNAVSLDRRHTKSPRIGA